MKNFISGIFRRRKFVIRPKLQYLLMILSISYVIFFCVIIGIYLFIPLMTELDKSDIGSNEAWIAAKRILYLNEKFWPAMLLALFAIACHSIFISHKIVGPIYRFNRIFKSLKEGMVLPPFQLRKNDYLYEEMEIINEMLERFRERLTDLQEAQAQLNQSLLRYKDIVRQSSEVEFRKKMEDLIEQGRKVEEKMKYFKVVS